MTEKYTMIAKTLAGLETVLAEELENLGAENVRIGRRMVSFDGDKRLMYRANIALRTALKILVPIYEFEAEDTDLLYASLSRFDWDTIMDVSTSFSVDTVAYSHLFTHTQYITYKTKDAIVDYFSSKDPEGRRPSVKLSNPDLCIHVHISEKKVTLSLDSSGESLHKRGYRVGQGKAPINEVLAAGILLKAGWHGQCDLLDPFAGSGTFLIEAALIARNIAPGIFRERYAFEKWKTFDEDLYKEVYENALEEQPFEHKIWGSDISFEAVSIAKTNINRAGLQHDIDIRKCNFKDVVAPSKPCILVMNPPYGERIRQFATQELYAMIGSTLKKQFTGCSAWIIADKKEHFASIALKHSYREELYNGSILCELRGYDLFEGSRKEFKTRGEEGAIESMEAPQKHTEERFEKRKRTSMGKRFENKGFRQEMKKAQGKTNHFEENRSRDDRQPKKFREESPRRFKDRSQESLSPKQRTFVHSDGKRNTERSKSSSSKIQVFSQED